MSVQSDLVIAGFLKLSAPEKQTVVDAIDRFYKSNPGDQKVIQEDYTGRTKRYSLGPMSHDGVCTCCGR